MYKLHIIPTTNQIVGFTKIADNIPTYSTDIIVDTIPVGLLDNYKYENGKIVEIPQVNTQTLAIEDIPESDTEYFISLINVGKTVDEAARLMKERHDRIEADKQARKAEEEKIANDVKNFYLAENKKRDALISPKHYSSIVLLIKDENRYLKEWLDWHSKWNFDHIYIYDNGTKDNVTDVAKTYANVTVIDWKGHYNNIQEDAYNHFLVTYGKEVRWSIFLDSDEFLNFTKVGITDVNTFLNGYEDYTEVWGYEQEYDANGQEKYVNKPVRERFTKLSEVMKGTYHKNFVQVNRIDSFKRHYAYYDSSKHLVFKDKTDNKDLFVIDHYYTKSWEEWYWKIGERGSCDPNYLRSIREFFIYNPDMKHLDNGLDVTQPYEGIEQIAGRN